MPMTYEDNLQQLDISIIDANSSVVLSIPHYNIIEYNMIHSILNIKNEGDLLFYDYEHVIDALPLHSSYKLQVKYIDKYSFDTIEYYNIIKVDKELKEQVFVVKLELVDEYYFNLSRTYSSNGYPEGTDFVTVINNYINVTKTTIMGEKVLDADKIIIEDTFVVPGHISFSEFILYMMREYDFLFFISRNKIYIKKLKGILDNLIDATSLVIKKDHNQSINPLKLFDLSVQLVDKLKSVKENPSIKRIDANIHDKQIKANISGKSYASLVREVNSSGIITNPQDTAGYKLECDDNLEYDNPYYLDILSKNIIEVTLRGTKGIEIGSTIGLEILLPGSQIINRLISGKWIIVNISEKIIGKQYSVLVTLVNPTLGNINA